MGKVASLEDRPLFSERDVTIDRSKLKIGITTWPLDKLAKLERQEPPFGLPPKHFLIGGAITLLLAYFVGGFFGFIFFCAGVGANVWWFLTQRTYGLVINSDAGAQIAGKWTGSGASEFVNEVMRGVENTKRRIEVRRKMLSAKRPFVRFGPAIEARLEKLQACDRFEEPGEFQAFVDATLDAIHDDRDLTNEMAALAGDYVIELVSIAIEKLREERPIATDDAGDGHVARSLEAQRVYEQGLDLLRSDDGDIKLEGVKLVYRATELDPNHMAALITLGKAFLLLDKADEAHERLAIAIDIAKRAVRADPSNQIARNLLWGAHFNDGRRHLHADRWNEAFDAFKESLIADPQSFSALAFLQRVGDEAHRQNDVEEVFIGLVAKTPPFDAKGTLSPQAEELLESAKLSGRNGNWTDAFDICIKSLDAQASVDAWLMLIVAANQLGRSDELHEIKMRLLSQKVEAD